MKLALRELRRRPGRFAAATAILTLVAILLMFLGGLVDGLFRSLTGAIRAQPGEVIVYSQDAEASFVRSRVEATVRATIEAVDGVEQTGGLGVVQLGARVPGNGPRELANVALFGYELPSQTLPAPPAPGLAYADEVLEADGIEIGMTIELGPARSPVEIIGFLSDTSFNGQGGVWTEPTTWRTILAENRPESRLGDGVFQALVVVGSASPADIDAATSGQSDAYSIDGAIDAIPGVTEQRSTFNQIIGVTVAIALAVIALFFALITVERTSLYGVLKAIGARTGTIFAGLIAQAVAVTTIAALIAVGAVVLLDLAIPASSFPLQVTVGRIATSIALLLLAAIVGCLFSLRRVLRIDPASAIG